MKSKTKIICPLTNLGDCLWITPITRYLDCEVVLPDSEKAHLISKLFDGIADVSFEEIPNSFKFYPDREIHKTIQIFSSFNVDITGKDLLPYVRLTAEELSWATDFLRPYVKPIVMINDNSGSHDKNNTRARIVRPPINIMNRIAAKYHDSQYTILQFGVKEGFYSQNSQHFTPLPHAIPIRGLTIRELAACYKLIGEYIGGDTGDYHLMIAVQGKAQVLIPKENENLGYIYSNLLYPNSFFASEQPRVKYLQF